MSPWDWIQSLTQKNEIQKKLEICRWFFNTTFNYPFYKSLFFGFDLLYERYQILLSQDTQWKSIRKYISVSKQVVISLNASMKKKNIESRVVYQHNPFSVVSTDFALIDMYLVLCHCHWCNWKNLYNVSGLVRQRRI